MKASSTRQRNQAPSANRPRPTPSSITSPHTYSQRSLSSTGYSAFSSSPSSSDSAETAVPLDRQSSHDSRAMPQPRNDGVSADEDERERDERAEEEDEVEEEDDVPSTAGETEGDVQLEQLGPTHYLPLLFVALPLLGGAFLGRADSWSDGLVLVLVGWWMWFLIKTPWELYHSSLHHHLLTSPTSDHHPSTHHAHSSLSQTHNLFLLLTLLSPLLGSLLLHLTRTYALSPSASDRYINSFNIRLFLLASSVKPILNLTDVLRNRTAALKKVLGKPKEDEWERVKRRVVELEDEVKALREGKAEKRELGELREELGGKVIGDLGKAVRRQERRGELTRLSLSERVDLLSTQLVTVQAELDYARAASFSQSRQALTWFLSLLHLQTPQSYAINSSPSPPSISRHQPQLINTRQHPKQPPRLQFASPSCAATALPHIKPTKLNQHPTPYPSARHDPLSPPSSLSPSSEDSPQFPGASPAIAAHRNKARQARSQTKTSNSRRSISSSLFGLVWRDLVMLPVQIGWSVTMMPVRIGLWALSQVV